MRTILRKYLVPAAVGFLAPMTVSAQTSAAPADSAFRSSDWNTAAAAYQKITAGDSTNAQAWFRLGFSYHSLGDWPRALTAYAHARKLGFQPVTVRYRLARVYARQNDPNHAFEMLDSAVTLAPGFFTPQQLDAEKDFDLVRSDSRYAKLSSALAAARYPCRSRPEAQQLDFWVGQWDVTPWTGNNAPGQQPGFNDVHPILEKCVVFESWRGPQGGEGKSFNYYDTNLNKWRQIWVADSGNSLDYTGEFRDGAMRFVGWTLDAQGHRVEQKLTFTPIDPNTVRQTFEASSDGGKTWTVTFDGRYVRRK
jgi:tetratricopeptide (TPR) repeat protein